MGVRARGGGYRERAREVVCRGFSQCFFLDRFLLLRLQYCLVSPENIEAVSDSAQGKVKVARDISA